MNQAAEAGFAEAAVGADPKFIATPGQRPDGGAGQPLVAAEAAPVTAVGPEQALGRADPEAGRGGQQAVDAFLRPLDLPALAVIDGDSAAEGAGPEFSLVILEAGDPTVG